MINSTLSPYGESLRTFFLVVCYGVISICLLFFMQKNILVTQLPSAKTLLRWDANVYWDIVNRGYVYEHPQFNNTGCFIFFPWLWRTLHVGVVGMCCFNYLFYAVGFTLLTRLYRLTMAQKMLWLSLPPLYMMMIPYTEAIFFLQISVTFYGIVKRKRWMIWIGLFSASLTRPTGIFLLPAFLAMVMLCKDQEKKWTGIFKVYCIDYGLPILAGTALFVWYQHHAIGIWFAYFIQQRKYEGHAFAMTILPFASYEGPRILWISALAMLCCFLSLVVIILKLYKRFFKKAIEPDRLLIVSLVYFIITLYKTAFYNPIWGAGTTLTIGISRYVFATPFFFVFLNHFTNRERSYKPIHFLLMFLLCNIVWLSCGSYKHILTTLYFNFLTLIVFAYMLLPDKKYQWPAMAIMGVNVVLQVLSFQHYLANYYLD